MTAKLEVPISIKLISYNFFFFIETYIPCYMQHERNQNIKKKINSYSTQTSSLS